MRSLEYVHGKVTFAGSYCLAAEVGNLVSFRNRFLDLVAGDGSPLSVSTSLLNMHSIDVLESQPLFMCTLVTVVRKIATRAKSMSVNIIKEGRWT